MHRLFPLLFLLICLLLSSTPGAAAPKAPGASRVLADELEGLERQDRELNAAADQLLGKLKAMRQRELEAMRRSVLDKVEDWDTGLVTLDGQSLKTTLQNAYRVAEANGMDTARLKALYETTKQIIRRFDFASLCGTDIGIRDQLIGNMARGEGIAADALHYFELADKAEERMACAQERRVMLYRNTARAFVLALAAKNPSDSVRGFREYAENIRSINDSEAMAIAADCEKLAARQQLVAQTAELIPLAGDAMDILAVYQGRDLAGNEVAGLDAFLRMLMLLTPEALEQVGKRFPDALPRMAAAMHRLAAPEGGAVERLIAGTGRKAGDVKAKAGRLLAGLGDKARLVKQGTKQTAAQAADKAKAMADTVAGINRLKFVSESGQSLARSGSDMPEKWVKALSETASNRNEIIMIRPVNPHAKAWLENGRAVGKGMHVKAKTASQGPLAGLIPADQQLSKLSDPKVMEELTREYKKTLARQASAQGEPLPETLTDAVLEQKARELARKETRKSLRKAQQAAEAARAGGYAKSVPLELDGSAVVTVSDQTGASRTLLKTAKGKYLDPKTRAPVSAGLDPNTEQAVQVLADPHTGKYFTADADLLGVGTTSGADHAAARTSTTGRQDLPADPDTDAAVWGNASAAEAQTAFEVNVQGRLKMKDKKGSTDRILQHGPAVRFHEKPDFPVTLFLPDKTVVQIGSEKELKQVMGAAKRNGVKGLEPHPAWGWGKDWWKEE